MYSRILCIANMISLEMCQFCVVYAFRLSIVCLLKQFQHAMPVSVGCQIHGLFTTSAFEDQGT